MSIKFSKSNKNFHISSTIEQKIIFKFYEVSIHLNCYKLTNIFSAGVFYIHHLKISIY